MTKPRLSAEEHAELGRVLASIDTELANRITQLENAYPTTGPESEPAARLHTARDALLKARAVLDTAMCREHPDAERFAYFPPTDERGVIVGWPRREQP